MAIIVIERCVVGIKRTARGAFLDPQQTLPLFVELAKRDSLFHKGDYQRSLCCLFDAANVSYYIPHKAQVLVFNLPHLRSTHQQLAVHRIWRWLGPDKASDYWDDLEDPSVVAAVEEVCQNKSLNCLQMYDWACNVATKRWKPSGHPHACDECYITRDDMKRAGHEKAALRDWHWVPSPMAPFLNLVKDPDDGVYDPGHRVALVLVDILLASRYFWLQTNDPEKMVAFEAICREATQGSWKPPKIRKNEQGEWRATCKQANFKGCNDAFWQAIENHMPASEDGLIAVDPRIPCCPILTSA